MASASSSRCSPGVCWGTYVLVAKRVGRTWSGSEGLAASMVVAAVALAPFGIASSGSNLIDPELLLLGAGVGVFAAAIPFALELHALRRLTATSYGVLTSLEPAVAGAAGFVLLGQRPGLAAVVAARAGGDGVDRGDADELTPATRSSRAGRT